MGVTTVRKKQQGFTLVELLIVIVVIAILAAITIIAYNGVTQKAHISTLNSDLSQNATFLATQNVENGMYPTDQASAGLKASDGTTLTYLSLGDGYCLQASGYSQTYHVTSDDSAPQSGECASGVLTGLVPDQSDVSATTVSTTLDGEHSRGSGTWFPVADGYIFGMYFSSSTDGQVSGVRFYKAADEATGNVGYLWNQAGDILAQVTFTDETASGWQSAVFSSPVSITAGTQYVVGYSDPSQYFAWTDGATLTAGITDGTLTTPQDATTYPGWWNKDNDAFCTTGTATDAYATGDDVSCATSGNLPVAGAWGANFFVDVLFTAS